MTNHTTIFYVPLSSDGTPKSSVPLEASYIPAQRKWVDSNTGFIVEFLGLIEGLDGAFSSPIREDVTAWIGALDIGPST